MLHLQINYMKNKLLSVTLACLVVFVLFEPAFSQTDEGERTVQNFITKQAKLKKVDEYADARVILRGDVNGDGKSDLVAQYTLEGFDGSNNFSQYLAVFLNNGKGFRYAAQTVVGGKNKRSMTLNSIKAGKINFEALEYLPKDPSCCPSKKKRVQFVFKGGKLTEI